MIRLLAADFADFLATWYGKTIFVIADVLIALLIVAVLYRPFFKGFFDFTVGLLLSVVTSPVWIVIAIVSKVQAVKTGEYKHVFKKTYYAGKRGKRFALYSFTVERDEDGQLTPLGAFLRRTGLEKLPYVFALVTLRYSLVGVKPIGMVDEKFVAEEDYERFLARPGMCNPLALQGKKKDLTYEEMFVSDIRYAKKYGFFRDVAILFLTLVHTVRGDGNDSFGEAGREEYARVLLDRGEIDRGDYDEAVAEEEEYLREEEPSVPAEEEEYLREQEPSEPAEEETEDTH